jgi:hypothetical protein
VQPQDVVAIEVRRIDEAASGLAPTLRGDGTNRVTMEGVTFRTPAVFDVGGLA